MELHNSVPVSSTMADADVAWRIPELMADFPASRAWLAEGKL